MARELVRVEGLKQLEDKLIRLLPAKTGKRVIERALVVASKPMVKLAKDFAKKGDTSGALSIAIGPLRGSKASTRQGRKAGTIFIGPRRSNRRAMAVYVDFYFNRTGRSISPAEFQDGIRHGHLIEFGTKRQAKQPFLRPAFDAQARPTVKRFGKVLAKEIDKALAKARAKGKR